MEPLWKRIFKYTFIICSILWVVCWVIIIRLAYLQIETPSMEILSKVVKVLQWILPVPVIINGFIYDYKRKQQKKNPPKK